MEAAEFCIFLGEEVEDEEEDTDDEISGFGEVVGDADADLKPELP